MKPKTQNRRFDPTGLAKPGKTHQLTGTGTRLGHQESAGRVFGWVWNRTDPFLRSKPGPLAGYPDRLLTLITSIRIELCNLTVECIKIEFYYISFITFSIVSKL
jgi:hypothetical protein